MIPDIGLMVGCYITTKMLSLIFKKDTPVSVGIYAWITVIITAISIINLVLI